jgi:hypothetical protein
MAGLVPAIHDLFGSQEDVDARHRGGRDGGEYDPSEIRSRVPALG